MGGVLHLNIIRETRRRTWACLPTCNICTTSPRWPVVLYSHSLSASSLSFSLALGFLSRHFSPFPSLSLSSRGGRWYMTPHIRAAGSMGLDRKRATDTLPRESLGRRHAATGRSPWNVQAYDASTGKTYTQMQCSLNAEHSLFPERYALCHTLELNFLDPSVAFCNKRGDQLHHVCLIAWLAPIYPFSASLSLRCCHMLGPERPEAVSPERGVALTDLQSSMMMLSFICSCRNKI